MAQISSFYDYGRATCALMRSWATAPGGIDMTIARWTPPVAPTRQEQFLLKRLGRVRKLLGFLRLHRHELFDDAFQEELASMYRTTGAGKDALPPAMMAWRCSYRATWEFPMRRWSN